jgi:anti-sigma B factor antagonist
LTVHHSAREDRHGPGCRFNLELTLPPEVFPMEGTLHTSIIHADGHAVVAVRGEIDLASAPQFEEALDEVLAHRVHTVLDFSGVTFMDSSGIAALVRASQRSDGPGLVIRNASDLIERTLEICGLADHFLERGSSAESRCEQSAS